MDHRSRAERLRAWIVENRERLTMVLICGALVGSGIATDDPFDSPWGSCDDLHVPRLLGALALIKRFG